MCVKDTCGVHPIWRKKKKAIYKVWEKKAFTYSEIKEGFCINAVIQKIRATTLRSSHAASPV